MSELGTCDFCDKPARWAIVVKGCSEHKIALKSAVENCNNNQQLKAEIAALVNNYPTDSWKYDSDRVNNLLAALRQLSAKFSIDNNERDVICSDAVCDYCVNKCITKLYPDYPGCFSGLDIMAEAIKKAPENVLKEMEQQLIKEQVARNDDNKS